MALEVNKSLRIPFDFTVCLLIACLYSSKHDFAKAKPLTVSYNSITILKRVNEWTSSMVAAIVIVHRECRFSLEAIASII